MHIRGLLRLLEYDLILIEVELLKAIEDFLDAALGIGVQIRHAFVHKPLHIFVVFAERIDGLHELDVGYVEQHGMRLYGLDSDRFVLVLVHVEPFHASFPHLTSSNHGCV